MLQITVQSIRISSDDMAGTDSALLNEIMRGYCSYVAINN